MDVKIVQNCSRCGRKEEKTVSLEIAQELNKTAEARKQEADNLPTVFNETFKNSLYPEIVVAVRFPGEEYYNVNTLDGLCERPGAERNKGCRARVNNLLKAVFEVEKTVKKTPKPKKEK